MFRIEYFQTLDSTNSYVLSRKDEDEGLVIVAENQTNGRGQNNRQWISDSGGLYFSILLKPKLLLPVLSVITGLVIIRTLESLGLENLKLKWPNDVLINDSKIAGILIESKIKSAKPEYVIIGCGININQLDFSGVTEYNPVSVKNITDKYYDVKLILEKFLEIFNFHYQKYLNEDTNDFIKEVQYKIYKKDQLVKINTYENNFITGHIKALNHDGALVIETEAGEKKLFSGRLVK